MGGKTSIEWTAGDDGSVGATWSTLRGCSWASQEECQNCYAMTIAARFSGPGLPFEGVAKQTVRGPRWTGKVKTLPESLDVPLHWKRPRRVFVNSMADTFHQKVPFEFIDRMFDTMRRCPRHTFMLLTKRATRMAIYAEQARWNAPDYDRLPPGNVWWGTSVGHPDFKSRIDELRRVESAAVRFLSLEPLVADLGELDLRGIHWVIAGGESGHGARPLDLEWLRSIRNQTHAAGGKFFLKQMGSAWTRGRGVRTKGGDPDTWPDDLRIRDFPRVLPNR